MKLLILIVCVMNLVTGSPIAGYKPLTPKELARLRNWTENDEGNVWQLSGQYQGDIVLTPEQLRNGIKDTTKIWPNQELPYMIGSGFSKAEKEKLISTLTEFETYSCVKLKLITEPVRDYVIVQGSSSGCFSNVGRSGGAQIMNLQARVGCLNTPNVFHEILHTLGFFHQHSAQERDDYLVINWRNIEIEDYQHFYKDDTDNFDTEYDYESVMHYDKKVYAINKLYNTIITKDENYQDVIGYAVGLSETDIVKLNRMYNCTGF